LAIIPLYFTLKVFYSAPKSENIPHDAKLQFLTQYSKTRKKIFKKECLGVTVGEWVKYREKKILTRFHSSFASRQMIFFSHIKER